MIPEDSKEIKATQEVAHTLYNTAALLQDVSNTLDKTRQELSNVSELTERVRRTSTLNALLTALTVIIIILTIVVVTEVRRDIGTNQQVIDTIQSCTTPGHECYDRNQRQSDQRLAPIVNALCEAVPVDRRKPPCPPVNTSR